MLTQIFLWTIQQTSLSYSKRCSWISIPPSEYDEELVVASNSTFRNNLEKIDNVILNELANQNLAPRQLIKKRAENERTSIGTSKTDSNEHFFKNSASVQL